MNRATRHMRNKNQTKFAAVTRRKEYPQTDGHVTLAFKDEDIGLIQLIEADTDHPQIVWLEVDKKYRNCGYGKSLLLSVPLYYKQHGMDLKEILVHPESEDTELTDEDIRIILEKIGRKLMRGYGVNLRLV